MFHKVHIQLLFLSAILFGCGKIEPKVSELKDLDLKRDASINYAKRFAIFENEKCKVIYLFGNSDISDTTATYVVLKDTSLKIKASRNRFILRQPIKKIASLSSVYTSMLCELGEIDNIAAIDNIDYYNNESVINKYKANQLAELNKNPEMDIEKTIVLNPDIIFAFGMAHSEKGPDQKIARANIPVVLTLDHLEESPLARAEWTKFFAAFVNKETAADSIFRIVEKNYLGLKNIASQAKNFPRVFTEIKYGDIWYVPGGKSFVAAFFNDANANYVWSDDRNTGSLHLGFEEVYTKAKEADYWLNLSLLKSKQELYALDKRYAEFEAYKKNNLYNNTKITNKNGYSTYWESGIMHPDKILSDMIQIFHPELKDEIKSDLNYYKKLE